MVTQSLKDVVRRYSGETYGRLLGAVYLSAAVVFVVGMVLERPAVGFVGFVGVYLVGVAADFALQRSSVVLYDERHKDMTRHASNAVFRIYGGGGFLIFVSLMGLEFAGRYEMGARVETLFLTWSAFVLTWGGFYTYYKYRN
ncbi:MAG: hypothetical protein U5J64_11560 [Halobacteriales archaeon]|nr:hypothetical protein [Halobacteriales archaeon]